VTVAVEMAVVDVAGVMVAVVMAVAVVMVEVGAEVAWEGETGAEKAGVMAGKG